jgi:hypothetical protein
VITSDTLAAIVAQYQRYGWTLRRVLLTAGARERSVAVGSEAVPVYESPIDAAWFSRSSRPGTETWELRGLHEPPFALLEVIDTDLDRDEREEILKATEQKMLESMGGAGK